MTHCQNAKDVLRKLDISNREEFAYNELAEGGTLPSIAHHWTMHEMSALCDIVGGIVPWSDDWYFGYSLTYATALFICMSSPLRTDVGRKHRFPNQRITLKGDSHLGKWTVLEHMSGERLLVMREGFLGRIANVSDVVSFTETIHTSRLTEKG